MNKQEFLKKYSYAPKSAGNCHQITWDLIEKMEEVFDDDHISDDNKIGATKYDVMVLLEVIREDIPDHAFLKQMETDLEALS